MSNTEHQGFNDNIPEFAQLEHRRDKNLVKVGQEGYDPQTLYIPPKDFKKLTPMMKHYWTIKSEHFDKIILWRMGKFYEMFYEDALIVNRHFDLTWMGNKLHVAIHHHCTDKYIQKLVDEGYKVALVD